MTRKQRTIIVTLAMVLASVATLSRSVADVSDTSGIDSWTKRGPFITAPGVISIAIHPNNRSIIYAATDQGVYRSSDAGETWTPKNQGLGGYGDLVVSGIAIDRGNPSNVYLGTWGYGVFKSSDSGDHWTRLNDPLATTSVQTQSTGGAPPPEVRGGGLSYASLHAVTLPDDLPPKGAQVRNLKEISPERFSPVEAQGLPNALTWTPVRRVAVHPTNPQVLYAAIHNGRGIWRSTNGGDNWTQLLMGNGSGRTVVFANNNTTALATYGDYNGSYNENGGVYRTTDGGSIWVDVGATITRTVAAVAFHPSDATRMYAATLGAGIYRSVNNGASWTQINNGLVDGSILSIAVSPSNPDILYAGGFMWVYRSDNGGDSWTIADSNYPAWYTEAVAVDPLNPNIFYAGAQRLGWLFATGLTQGGFYKSTAGAGDDNLVLKNDGMQDTFVLDIAQDPANANILYAGTWGSGLYRSDNGGVTWAPKNAMLTTPYVYSIEATTGPTGTILYAGTFYDPEGVFKSYDRGENWVEISRYDPTLETVVFDVTTAGSANTLAAATSRGVYWSNDGGQSWNAASDLNDGIVLEIARSPANPNRLVAGTYGGNVWISTDAGHSWTEAASGLGSAYVYDVVYAPDNANILYAGSYGVYRSTNGGSSWSRFGVSRNWIRALSAVGGTHDDVFAGTHDRGVYFSPDGSGSWRTINYGLTEPRIRTLEAVAADKIFAGTNGGSAWEYTVVDRAFHSYLPVIYVPPPPPALPSQLFPTADATVLQGHPSVNFGSTTDMWAGYDHCPSDGRIARSLIRFDVSDIPAGTHIAEARLYLRLINSCDIGERMHTATTYRINSSWLSSSVTWNSGISYAEAYGSRAIPSRTWGWYWFDVTALLQGWVNGTFPNYGLMVRSNESSGNDSARLGFATRDYSGTTWDPYLSITYSRAVSAGLQTPGVEELPLATEMDITISDTLLGRFPWLKLNKEDTGWSAVSADR